MNSAALVSDCAYAIAYDHAYAIAYAHAYAITHAHAQGFGHPSVPRCQKLGTLCARAQVNSAPSMTTHRPSFNGQFLKTHYWDEESETWLEKSARSRKP